MKWSKMIIFKLKEMMESWSEKNEKKLSVSRLSRETGINRVTLSMLANDRHSNVTTDIINKLCEFFDCGLEGLLEYKKDPSDNDQKQHS